MIILANCTFETIYSIFAMVNIEEIIDQELQSRIEEHERLGGALRISVFEIKENYKGEMPGEYDAHLAAARQALEQQNYECNSHFNKVAAKNERNKIPYAKTDFDKLDSSGQNLKLYHFLGPHFDLKSKKPLIRGRLTNATLNSYFYYDQEETVANKVDMFKAVNEFQELDPENQGNFMHALMEPPYSLRLDKEISKRGEYVLSFFDYFFGDLDAITIYAWNTDCSFVFESGKEWWGSYFWTVYNPAKNWYVAIIASETD